MSSNIGSLLKEMLPSQSTKLVTAITLKENENLVAGFRAAEICPLDQQQVLNFLPDLTYLQQR
jgi:hypothetical protein